MGSDFWELLGLIVLAVIAGWSLGMRRAELERRRLARRRNRRRPGA